MTAFKKAEDRDSVIIRLFNPTSRKVRGRINGVFKKACLVSLNEDYQGDIDLNHLEAAPYQILTVEVEDQ